jgi:tRNA (guanine37-N1)-methyltransferase
MGKAEAAEDDSFSWGILGFPVYTQPQEYRGLKVPEILISGHHENIRRLRRRLALRKTLKMRPELLQDEILTEEDRKILADIKNNEKNEP